MIVSMACGKLRAAVIRVIAAAKSLVIVFRVLATGRNDAAEDPNAEGCEVQTEISAPDTLSSHSRMGFSVPRCSR